MSVLQSKISTGSQAFRDNAARMEAQIAETAAMAELHGQGGPEASRERHVGRGKLLPRDRVATLLDADSPFLEIGRFAAHDLYGGDIASAGMIAGVGRVKGRDVVLPQVCSGVARATFFDLCAKPLGPDYLAKLKAQLERVTGSKIVLEAKEDPELLAGVIASVGDRVFDGSLLSRLRQMRETLAPS